MFEVGEYVVCGSKGVCVVENITTLDIAGVDKERKYYILKPIYQTGSTVYVPVDSPKDSLRRVMERRDAQKLIEAIPDVPLLVIANDKLTEQTYKESLKSGNCEEWVRIIKTIWWRKQQRLQAGRKMTALDAKYFHMAEESLYGELAVALDLNRDAVAEYIVEKIEK